VNVVAYSIGYEKKSNCIQLSFKVLENTIVILGKYSQNGIQNEQQQMQLQ